MTSDLKALRDIISSSVDSIVRVCDNTGRDFPSLDEPVNPSEFSPNGIRNDPTVAQSISFIVAAALQLVATVQSPPITLVTASVQSALPAALSVAEAGNIAEILRDAGPKGMHIKEIAKKSKMEARKLSHVLRCLATNHWFREVSPDVFANNSLSSLLDTGKEITDDFGVTKYENTPGMAAMLGAISDSQLTTFSALRDVMTDEKTKFSEEPCDSAFQKARNTNLSVWEYLDLPENEAMRKRAAIALAGSNKMQPPSTILSGFDWGSVPKGGVVVDVGGGLGQVALEISKAFPELQVVLEDRPSNVEQAKQFWSENLPSAVSNGTVHFIGMDFFEAQPKLPGDPSVFLLRNIIHDWSDLYCVKLLRRLREAATPTTKLVIVDAVLEYACGSGDNKPPAPLLGNLGGANVLPYSMDLAMFASHNAGERTKNGFEEILSASGWKLQEIRKHPVNPMFRPSIIAVPN
ncbi:S-adenosyl-L-methionine-dependent methyltransferase [Fomitiporia mediterranea MF3/22]|uniref:S-adenosyl-L-methionine-dependent methyltransferase n=1 Tax=Fomitiporia mediterranea (strain MF3/22) TaxID=694068 RepID=UPI00044095C8|nr:S-adenosyl-L-methionine-dependent methyltransferase [Fomitiporia mediterranea MF3/22]EJD01727.1 S-adenosyl-L-methionine-dependent methyltransferase [Fomitiporia mediterranea MF3/22]